MTLRHRGRQLGFSLIELMIAIALGLLAIAAVGSVFVYGSRNYKQDDKISRMQDELRFAMAQLSSSLEMAGFWAQIANPVTNITVADASWDTNCGPTTDGAANSATNNWVFRERSAGIAIRGNATSSPYALTGANVNATFPCIGSSDFHEGTDVVAIKHLGDVVTAPPTSEQIYLRTNGVTSVIYKHAANAALTANYTTYPYRVTVWYIRKWSESATENPKIPSLCRETLIVESGNPKMEGDSGGCVARGIEDMQFEFGLDSATAPDGVPDQFVEYAATPNADTLRRVVAVRIHLLARSAESDGSYKNEKAYTLGSKPIAVQNDGYYRRSMSSTVLLRNHAYRLNPYALPSA